MRKTPWMCRYQKRLQGCVLIPASSCLSPPVRVTRALLLNPHKTPHGYCLTAPLQLLCLCLALSAQGRSCWFITSHFKRPSLLLSRTFLSVLLFCYLANVSQQQFLPGSWSRERMQLQIGLLPKVIVFLPPVVTPSWRIGHVFCTPELSQRSDPYLWLPQKDFHLFFRLYFFKITILVTSRDLGNIKSVNSHNLLLSSTCCSACPCRSPWWQTGFHSDICEMCISLYWAPKLRCKIQLVGRFIRFVHSDLLQEPAEEVAPQLLRQCLLCLSKADFASLWSRHT